VAKRRYSEHFRQVAVERMRGCESIVALTKVEGVTAAAVSVALARRLKLTGIDQLQGSWVTGGKLRCFRGVTQDGRSICGKYFFLISSRERGADGRAVRRSVRTTRCVRHVHGAEHKCGLGYVIKSDAAKDFAAMIRC